MAISTHILRVPNKMKDVILSHDAIGTKVLLRLGGVGLWHRYRITRTYTQIQQNRDEESGVGQTPTTPDPSSFSRRTQGDSFGILLGGLRMCLKSAVHYQRSPFDKLRVSVLRLKDRSW